MSDGKIEQVPDKKGMHERVTGHATSVDTGRTVVPSAVGTTRGAQLGRDHSVAAPSTMVMPDGNRVPVVPPATGRAAQPYEVPAPPVPAAHAPAPVATLMAEEDGTPVPAPAAQAEPVVLLLTEERQAMERALLHFASFPCRPQAGPDGKRLLHILHEPQDEAELLIRVLAFGPLVRVLGPEPFAEQIRQRLQRQVCLWGSAGRPEA